MKKKLLIIAGAVFLLLIIGIIAAPFLIDINHFKPTIETTLSKHLNAEISVGHLKLSLIKGIGAQIEGLKISNPPNFPPDQLIDIARIDIQLGTLSSLIGSPNIKITLIKPNIKIYKNEEKQLNVKAIIKTEPAPDSTDEELEAPSKLKQGFLGGLIAKSKIHLKVQNGIIQHIRHNESPISIKDVNLTLGPLSLNAPVQLEMAGTLEPLVMKQTSLHGGFKIDTTISNPIKNKDHIMFSLNANMTNMIGTTPWITKPIGKNLNTSIKGTYTPDKVDIQSLNLEHPWGDLSGSGHVENLKQPKYETKLKFVFTTTEEDKQTLKFRADTEISFSAQGLASPFLIKTGKGIANIRNLSGQVPPFLKPILSSRMLMASGAGSLKGKADFEVINNKPTMVNFRDLEINLSPLLLNYQDKWSKPPEQILSLKLNGNFQQLETEKSIRLTGSSVQFGDMQLSIDSAIQLRQDKNKSTMTATLSSNTFQAKLFAPYLPKLPFKLAGTLKVPELTVSGNPLKPDDLDLQGKLSAPKGRLAFNDSYFQGKKWRADGPIHFSTNVSFHVAKKKIKSLNLNTAVDFAAADIKLEEQFHKPKERVLKLTLSSQLENDTFHLRKMNVVFHQMNLNAKGTVSQFSKPKKRYVNFTINTEPFELSEWNQFFPKIKEKFTGTSEFKNVNIAFPSMDPKNLTLSGKVSLNKVSGEIPPDLFQSKTMKIKGPFTIDLKSQAKIVQKTIHKLDLTGNIDLSKMGLDIKGQFHKPQDVPLRILVDTKSTQDQLHINQADLTLQHLKFSLTGKATKLKHQPDFDLNFKSPSFKIDDLKSFLPALKKKPLNGNLRLTGSFKGRPKHATSPLYLSFFVNSTDIVYAPPDNGDKKKDKEKPTKKKAQKTSKEIPFFRKPIFKRLNVTGKLDITKARLSTYKLWNIRATAGLSKGKLSVSPFRFQAYDGRFNSSTWINFNKKYPASTIQTSLDSFDVEKFLISQKSKAQGKLSGRLSSQMNISFLGMDGDLIKRSMTGRGKAEIRHGTFKVFNLSEALGGIPLLNQIAPEFDISDKFKIFKTSITIKDQKVHTPDIFLQGQRHLLLAKGILGFDGSLNYRGDYYLAPTPNPEKRISFTVGGTIKDPKPALNYEGLVQSTIHGVFDKILKPKDGKSPTPKKEPEKEAPVKIIEDILGDVLF